MFETNTTLPLEPMYLRPSPLPKAYRLEMIGYRMTEDLQLQATAVVAQAHLQLRVSWCCHRPDPRLIPNSLVSIRWGGLSYAHEAFQIEGLDPMEDIEGGSAMNRQIETGADRPTSGRRVYAVTDSRRFEGKEHW